MNEPIRWGIAGCGDVATRFARDLRLCPDARIAAVASRNRQRAQAFSERFGSPRVHGTVGELASDPALDVVYVATPNHLHLEHGLQVLQGGKPLLCEKPLARSAAEAAQLISAARGAGLFCMEAMWMRFVPAMVAAQKELRRGVLGAPRCVVASLGIEAPSDPANRFFDPGSGGGALLDLGVYAISLALSLLGAPRGISGRALIGPSGVDEVASCDLEFDGGARAMLAFGLLGPMANDARVFCASGRLHIHAPLYRPESFSIATGPGNSSAAHRPASFLSRILDRPAAQRLQPAWRRRIVPLLPGGDRTFRLQARGGGYVHEAMETMRCIRAGLKESPEMTLDHSLAILRVADQLRAGWRAEGVGAGSERP